MKYDFRVKEVTSKTRGYKDLIKFKKHADKFKEGKNVIIKRGLMKNLQGTITGKPQVVLSKKFIIIPVRVRDVGKAIRGIVGTNKFYYTNKEIKLTGKRYKSVMPLSSE